jgi:hypothetical protein
MNSQEEDAAIERMIEEKQKLDEMTEEQRVTLSEMFLLKTKPWRKVGSHSFNRSGSKYLREIPCLFDEKVDVYAVLDAFDVRCPARQHAIKKLLCAGLRGAKDVIDDLREARDAIDRAIQMQHARELDDDES